MENNLLTLFPKNWKTFIYVVAKQFANALVSGNLPNIDLFQLEFSFFLLFFHWAMVIDVSESAFEVTQTSKNYFYDNW